jgi:hypothetical protein
LDFKSFFAWILASFFGFLKSTLDFKSHRCMDFKNWWSTLSSL